MSDTSKTIDVELVVKALAALAGVVFFGLILFRVLFVTYVDQYELPYQYDRVTGQVSVLNRTGYFVRPPLLVAIYGIDLRPHQVLLQVGGAKGTDAASTRVLNAKLVQFNPAGLKEFIALHGLQGGDVSEILKIYAYDQQGRSFPFLKVDGQTASLPSESK